MKGYAIPAVCVTTKKQVEVVLKNILSSFMKECGIPAINVTTKEQLEVV